MPEFLHLRPPADALKQVLDTLPEHPPQIEWLETRQAAGRVLAQTVLAPEDSPAFDRSTVDGYAVRAADTFGASESLPAYLKLAGEVPMGAAPAFELQPGQCALIHTGGMLPAGADAVVMVETTQTASEDEIEVLRPVAENENRIRAGEDVRKGEPVLAAGARLRPAEIGGLMALGITRVAVSRPPTVGILSTGDEVVPPEQSLRPGQVRDVNTYTLSALVEQAGGRPHTYGILPDNAARLAEQAAAALAECDLVVITAGSSASVRDLTAEVIQGLGAPGVLAHGVNVRPGKPTILAVCDGKPVVGLPGNPVSALVIAGLFVPPLLDRLLGVEKPAFQSNALARLTVNLPSQTGREDWVPVRLVASPDGLQAEPIFYKSNLIFSLAHADGLLCIPPDANGLPAGCQVEVMRL